MVLKESLIALPLFLMLTRVNLLYMQQYWALQDSNPGLAPYSLIPYKSLNFSES